MPLEYCSQNNRNSRQSIHFVFRKSLPIYFYDYMLDFRLKRRDGELELDELIFLSDVFSSCQLWR